MSSSHVISAPRLLLFPQVGGPDGKDGRPAVRRYTLTMLPGAPRTDRGGRPVAKPARA